MPEQEVVALSRPETAALQDAVTRLMEGFDAHPPQQMMQAGLVVVAEACAQLDNEKKSPAEVVAALVEYGLSPGMAQPWVDKAEEIVNSTINRDPEQFLRERRAWGITGGEMAVYFFAAVFLYIMWPW